MRHLHDTLAPGGLSALQTEGAGLPCLPLSSVEWLTSLECVVLALEQTGLHLHAAKESSVTPHLQPLLHATTGGAGAEPDVNHHHHHHHAGMGLMTTPHEGEDPPDAAPMLMTDARRRAHMRLLWTIHEHGFMLDGNVLDGIRDVMTSGGHLAGLLYAWHNLTLLLGAQQLHTWVALAWAVHDPASAGGFDVALRELLQSHAEMHEVEATPWWEGYWLGGWDPLAMLYALVGDPDRANDVLHAGAYPGHHRAGGRFRRRLRHTDTN